MGGWSESGSVTLNAVKPLRIFNSLQEPVTILNVALVVGDSRAEDVLQAVFLQENAG